MDVMQLLPHGSMSQKCTQGTVTLLPSGFPLPQASCSTQQGLRDHVRVTPWEAREALQLARDSMTDGEAHAYPKPIAQATPVRAAFL